MKPSLALETIMLQQIGIINFYFMLSIIRVKEDARESAAKYSSRPDKDGYKHSCYRCKLWHPTKMFRSPFHIFNFPEVHILASDMHLATTRICHNILRNTIPS